MMKCFFCPYIYRHLQAQMPKQGLRGSMFLLVCALSAVFVYGRSWIHNRMINIFMKVSSRMWWNRRPGSNVVDPSPPASLPEVETYLKSPETKWTTTMVRPTNPLAIHWQSLSNLDRVVNPTFSSVILYYRSDSMTERKDVSKILKESLGDVLSAFYPLAGRLTVRADGLADGLVDLHCNNEGAPFLEVQINQELSAFGELRPMPDLSGLTSNLGIKLIKLKGPPYLPDQLSPMPVLIVQLTRFKCGSIALAANWHHTVADGSSGCHFMKSWAEVASGRGISLQPYHNRSVLNPRNPLDPSLVNTSGYSTKVMTADSISSQNAGQKPPVVDAVFISKERVDEIKIEVEEEAQKYPQYASNEDGKPFRPYSSAECLSAWLWRAFTRSRHGNSTRDSDTRFFMFVDGRGRLQLAQGYFGNVVCSACALSTEKRLDSEPLIYAAYLIRKAVDGVSSEYFLSLIDWVATHGLSGSSKSEHVNSLGHDVAATFWNRFPIYKMDFGWGAPDFGARNSPPRELIDGFSVMPSNTDNRGDMVALINLHGDRLERLRKEETFRRLVN